jgi:hypothetical protein
MNPGQTRSTPSFARAVTALQVYSPAQLFWRDTMFAVANIYLGGMALWLQWPWAYEAFIYVSVMLLLRPLVLRRDNTVTPLNLGYAIVIGTISWFAAPLTFSGAGGPGPDLDTASGWPLWAALPGMWFVVFNGLTYRIKVYRYWPHAACIPLLILMGLVAMWELHHVLSERGFGYNFPAQLLFWSLWAIPLLHDRRIHPREREWT